MAITYIGAGTAATAVNTSVSPGVHASTAVGDMVIIIAAVRPTSGTPGSQPSGWLRIAGLANFRLYAKVWAATDGPPTFVPTGTGAGDDVYAQAFTFRGVEKLAASVAGGQDTDASVTTNAAAQNIDKPGYDMPAERHAAIMACWKQSAITTLTTPSGMTRANLASVTAGNDMGISVDYAIQLTESDFNPGTLTATGGTVAVSSVIWIYMRPAATLTVTSQDTWPVRNLIQITGLTVGDSIQVYRVINGQRTALRAGSSASVTDQAFLVTDAELPFGVSLSYVAVVNSAVTYESSAATYTLVGGKVAVTDAISGLAAEVVIQEWPRKRRERRATTYVANGKNITVSGPLGQFTGQATLYTETTSSGENLLSTLEQATGGVIQIRQPGGYDGVDCYVSVLGVDEQRYDETTGTDERRLWTLDLVETDPWRPGLSASGYSYEDLADAYDGLTYADLANDYSTYLELSQAEFP